MTLFCFVFLPPVLFFSSQPRFSSWYYSRASTAVVLRSQSTSPQEFNPCTTSEEETGQNTPRNIISILLWASLEELSGYQKQARMGSWCHDISSTRLSSREPHHCNAAERHNSSRFIINQNNVTLCGRVSLAKRHNNKADMSWNVTVTQLLQMWFAMMFTFRRNVGNNTDSVHSNMYVCSGH